MFVVKLKDILSFWQGTLVLLASITAYENWKRATAFREQLPSPKDFLSHPIASCFQVIEIYKLDIARTSAETAERRKMKTEDAQKRSIYRRAHGLENDENQSWGGSWTEHTDEETLAPSLKLDGPASRTRVTAASDEDMGDGTAAPNGDSKASAYVDWESKKRPIKRWLGIW